jgi:integral membrane sensor domain MASE1
MQRAAEAPWIDQPGAGRLRYAMLLGALVIVYFFAGKLGLHFAFVHASASAVWPPTGIALGAALLFGFRVWPAIFIGAFLAKLRLQMVALTMSRASPSDRERAFAAGIDQHLVKPVDAAELRRLLR